MNFFRLFDSWGKPPSGILQGNRFWLGRPEMCLNILPANVGFETNFCVLRTSSFDYGLCLPGIGAKMTIKKLESFYFFDH